MWVHLSTVILLASFKAYIAFPSVNKRCNIVVNRSLSDIQVHSLTASPQCCLTLFNTLPGSMHSSSPRGCAFNSDSQMSAAGTMPRCHFFLLFCNTNWKKILSHLLF
ncbi:cyclin B1, isoform CRA_c [Rattus norvegicus]|uniref:Cyclin B1, isoform CRA_c n=1 Tax=Rattus norvegicus TaxID=10116 RepID=A6I5B2_RAT|nr:cyclin B1, isoform CRA_c [Rattus norvegicus]